MNNFAGTLTFTGQVVLNKIQEKYIVSKSADSDNTTVFIFGKTLSETSEEILKEYANVGELYAYDISISTEDNMTMLNNEVDKDGLYEVVTFESPVADIRNVVERFQDSFEIICIREAEESEKYGNRVIRADFIY